MSDPGLRHHRSLVGEVNMHYVTAGDPGAVPVLLVHGFPRSWYEWRHVIPLLADSHYVIAPDLRGSGDSSKPAGGFDKRTMSHDLVRLLDLLGIGRPHVVGRDWGAATALAVALHWQRARTLTFMENLVPGFGYEQAVLQYPGLSPSAPAPADPGALARKAASVGHVIFHITPDLPEFLIAGREREYFGTFMTSIAANTAAIDAACIDECARCLSMPGALRATLGYTRAYFTDADDNRKAVAERGKLAIPVLAMGGEYSLGTRTAATLERVAESIEADAVPGAGHWVADEAPQWLADRLIRFFTAR
jgi:pimeloyl-ACP methyl ester carboxylesterase